MSTRIGNSFWVGVDLAKDSFEAAVAPLGTEPSEWRTLATASYGFDRKGVKAFVKALGGEDGQCLGVCVESTGVYSFRFLAQLARHGLECVSIVNPARPVAFGRSLGVRDKTDCVDAAVLAIYGLVHKPRVTLRRPAHYQHLRDLWRAREQYVGQRTALVCRLEQTDNSFVRRELRSTLRHVDGKIERLDAEMDHCMADAPELAHDAALLETIPGVGRLTAWLLLGELGDLRAWGRNELVGYAGLFPRRYESGTSVHRAPRLARGGGGRIRKGLYLCACVQRRLAGPLRDYSDALIDRGKAKMQAICALMRKILLIARAVVVSERPFAPQLLGAQKTG